jgi:peptide/nickel transport system substrate-binding protein
MPNKIHHPVLVSSDAHGRYSRRSVLKTAAAVAAGTMMGATLPLGRGTAQAAEKGGTLVWGMPAETDILDPHATGGWLTYDVTFQIFEGLAKEDLTKGAASYPPLVPALAKSWEVSKDGTQYTFMLREGVKFHDGSPFDAEAVKFNFDRFWNEKSPDFYPKARAFVAGYTKWIKSVEVLGPMTVQISLTQPNYEWIRTGLQSYGQPLMVSPAAVKKHGNEGIALHPIGTGPFKFVERQQGVKTVLARNDSYWGTPAKLDRLIFRPLEDPVTRTNALRTGEVNMITTPVWDDIQGLVKDGFVLSTNANVPDIFFLYLNTRTPQFQDVRVRRAVNMAIDREGIARDIYKGTGRPEYGMLSPGTWAYDPKFRMYEYNPDEAKKLLAEAGHPNGFKLGYATFQYGTGQLVETWIQRDLKKIGIDAEITKSEWITYMHNWAQGYPPEVGVSQMGWGMTVPSWIGLVTRSDALPPNGLNSGWYDNPKIDPLLNAALAEPDAGKSAEIYRRVNKMIMEDAAYVPIIDDLQPVILAKSVKGLVNPPEDWFDLSTVWIEG